MSIAMLVVRRCGGVSHDPAAFAGARVLLATLRRLVAESLPTRPPTARAPPHGTCLAPRAR